MNKDFLHRISENMHGFSKGQKRIGNFILEHYDPETKELVLQETPIVEEVPVEEVNNMLNDGMLREAEPSSEEETPVDEAINEDAAVSNDTSESSEVEEGCFSE